MENKKEIQTSKTHYGIIKANSTKELLKATPIVSHKDYKTAQHEIGKALVDCCDSMGVNLTDRAVYLLTMDLIDKYKHDSIEDIVFCLRKGRQGFYGNNYGKLNLIVISEWMAQHLESKALEREKHLNKLKEKKETLPDVDYEAYKIRSKQQKEEQNKQDAKEEGYKKFLADYLNEKQQNDS